MTQSDSKSSVDTTRDHTITVKSRTETTSSHQPGHLHSREITPIETKEGGQRGQRPDLEGEWTKEREAGERLEQEAWTWREEAAGSGEDREGGGRIERRSGGRRAERGRGGGGGSGSGSKRLEEGEAKEKEGGKRRVRRGVAAGQRRARLGRSSGEARSEQRRGGEAQPGQWRGDETRSARGQGWIGAWSTQGSVGAGLGWSGELDRSVGKAGAGKAEPWLRRRLRMSHGGPAEELSWERFFLRNEDY